MNTVNSDIIYRAATT